MSDLRPCKGDAYRPNPVPSYDPHCGNCSQLAPLMYDRGEAITLRGGKCLGTDGYRFMALVASEVAAERITPRIGSTRSWTR